MRKWASKLFTTLELAALPSLVDPEEQLELGGLNDQAGRSVQWWGRPDSRGDHVRTCQCGDCS